MSSSITISSFFNKLSSFHSTQSSRASTLQKVIQVSENAAFEFEKVIALPKARELFQDHVRLERNEEMLLFIQKVQDYKKIAPGKNFQEQQQATILAKQIISNFLQSTSRFEINVPKPEKSEVLNTFGKIYLQEPPPANLFDKLQNHLLHSLKEDVFPRFLKSNPWRQFLLSLNEETLNNILKQHSLPQDSDPSTSSSSTSASTTSIRGSKSYGNLSVSVQNQNIPNDATLDSSLSCSELLARSVSFKNSASSPSSSSSSSSSSDTSQKKSKSNKKRGLLSLLSPR